MNRNFARSVVAVSALAMLASCATLPPPGTALTPEQRKKAQTDCIVQYTAVGAIGGALLGQLLGGNTKGTLIGAAAGGLLGGALAWGHCLQVYSNLTSYPMANAQATSAQTGWTPARGNEVKVQNFMATPATVRPGGTVNLNGSYYVMAPGGATEVKVVETRSVSYFDPAENQWKDLGSVDQNVTAALGTRRAEGTFDLPNDVPEGRYRISLKVAALGKADTMVQEIVVRKS